MGILTSDLEIQDDCEDRDLLNDFSEDPLHNFPPNKVCIYHSPIGYLVNVNSKRFARGCSN